MLKTIIHIDHWKINVSKKPKLHIYLKSEESYNGEESLLKRRFMSNNREERLCCNNEDVKDEHHVVLLFSVKQDHVYKIKLGKLNFIDVEKLHFLLTNKNFVRKTAVNNILDMN